MAEKKVFSSINEIEVQIEASHKVRQQRLNGLLKDYLKAREPLLERRFDLVTGRSEPTDEELKGFTPQGAAAAAAAVSSAADAKAPATGSTRHGKGGKGQAARGVPFFWLNALCNEEELAEVITSRDRCALEYLEDIRYINGPKGIVLEFHFAPNPYFYNTVLRKGAYIVKRQTAKGPDGESTAAPGPLGVRAMEELMRGVEGWRDESTLIDWKPGRSLLIRSEPSGATNKKKATAAAVTVRKKSNKGKAGNAAASTSGGGGGGGSNKDKAGKRVKGRCTAGVPSRSKRHQGKHTGPAPDLPDPDDPEQEEEEEAEEDVGEGEGEEGAVHDGASSGSRQRPCPSFFRFFLPLFDGKMWHRKELDPTVDEDEDGSEEEEEEEEANSGTGQLVFGGSAGTMNAAAAVSPSQHRRQLDAEVMDIIVKRVVPRAVHLYLAGNVTIGKSASRTAAGGGDDADSEEEGFQLVSGSPAGEVASLALGAQKALHVLMAQQRQLDDMASELKRAEWELWVFHQQEVTGLLARRRTMLVGPAGAPGNKMSIPAFWLRALRGVPYGSLLIQHRDERALSYLADVRLLWDTSRMPTPENPHRKLDLELEFLTNPYFSNRVLRKSITFYAPRGSLNRMWVQFAKSDPIEWHPGRDLTVKLPPAAGTGGEKAASARSARPRKVPSFFAFFDDSQAALLRAFSIPGGQSAATMQEANQAQEEFIAELINFVVHFAGSLAAESTVDVNDLGDEREDEEEEEEEEDEDDDNDGEEAEGEASQAGRAKKAAAKAARKRGDAAASDAGGGGGGGGGGSGSGLLHRLLGGGSTAGLVIAVLATVMLVAQVLVFLDTLEHVRSRFKWTP